MCSLLITEVADCLTLTADRLIMKKVNQYLPIKSQSLIHFTSMNDISEQYLKWKNHNQQTKKHVSIHASWPQIYGVSIPLHTPYTLAYSVYPCILPPCAAESSGVMGKRRRRNTSKNPHSSDGRNGQRKDDATLKESN